MTPLPPGALEHLLITLPPEQDAFAFLLVEFSSNAPRLLLLFEDAC